MKIGIKSLLAVAVLAIVAVQANAQTYPFDSAASISAPAGSRNYGGPYPPLGVGFDNGTATPVITESTTYSASQQSTISNPTSHTGAVLMSWAFNNDDGNGQAAWTIDVSAGATAYSEVQFDYFVDEANSTLSGYGDYGYFQAAARIAPGALDTNSVASADYDYIGTSFGTALLGGGWHHADILLTTGPDYSGSHGGAQIDSTHLRGITLQDYNDAGPNTRNITGFEYLYIDNLQLTAVPEPASLALLGLAAPGLVFVARRYRKTA
ncbi:MAG TPA: PEP-CTERM sorting domain-containing protein [Pirellulales bacterium]|jgi:hypothetical protein